MSKVARPDTIRKAIRAAEKTLLDLRRGKVQMSSRRSYQGAQLTRTAAIRHQEEIVEVLKSQLKHQMARHEKALHARLNNAHDCSAV